MIVLVLVLFGVLYALVLLPAISNLVALPEYYAFFGIGDATPWALLVAGVALPVVGYVVAVLLGRRRPAADRAILLAAGLAVTWALTLSLAALVQALQPAILPAS